MVQKDGGGLKPYWQSSCGRHVIYHGDSREILPTLADGSVDLVFTDPPYGHNNNNGDLIHNREKALGKKPKEVAKSRPIANDGPEANGLVQWLFSSCRRILAPGCCCCCCCCGGGGPDPQFARWSLWMDEHLDFKQMVVWDKGPIGMGWHYRRSYETILVGTRRGAKCRWFDSSYKIENVIRPGDYGIKKIIPSKRQHPTEKPVALAQHFIRLHSRAGDLVCDPFMGHGSTGEACMREGRRFIGVEFDREFCDAATKRLEEAAVLFAEVA